MNEPTDAMLKLGALLRPLPTYDQALILDALERYHDVDLPSDIGFARNQSEAQSTETAEVTDAMRHEAKAETARLIARRRRTALLIRSLRHVLPS